MGSSALLGWGEPAPGELRLVFGLPAWIFWCVALPWAAAVGFTIWFALGYMGDEPVVGEGGEEGPLPGAAGVGAGGLNDGGRGHGA